MNRLLLLAVVVATCVTSVVASGLYDHPTFDQFERAIAAAEGRPYVPRPARKTDPTFDQMERLIRAIEDGAAATNSVTLAAFDYATNMLAQVKRDKDDLAVYRKVKDIWKWENWRHEDADADAPADFLAAANSPGSYPLAYRTATGSWMYANQYWPNGNVKYDSQMPPGGHEGALSTNLLFKFRAFPESGGTNILFSFGAKASRVSATDETLVEWEKDGPQHVAPVRIVTTDLVGIELEHKVSRDDLAAATNSLRRVDGAARPLPKYLHALDFASSYPEAAAEYYSQRLDHGGCSAVRDGGFLYRNFDFPLDDRAEFVVRMAAGEDRFASVGVAQVGTNLTEDIVTSGKWSKWYKALPGATVDGINENGVCAEINVVDGTPPLRLGDIHPLAAVRWALDNAKTAEYAATSLAARVSFPAGWTQNFHWMISDERETWIVENGSASNVTAVEAKRVMTNFPILPDTYEGTGKERYALLSSPASCITNAWYTRAYLRTTDWASEFKDAEEMEAAKSAWETHTREELRGRGLWQTVHTSVYDLTNRVLRIAVQETDDWYAFQVPDAGGLKEEVDPTVPAWAKSAQNPSYTKAETDAKLADKADEKAGTDEQVVRGEDLGGYWGIAVQEAVFASDDGSGNNIAGTYAKKAAAPVTAGNIASLDDNGDLADSGIAANDILRLSGGEYLTEDGWTLHAPYEDAMHSSTLSGIPENVLGVQGFFLTGNLIFDGGFNAIYSVQTGKFLQDAIDEKPTYDDLDAKADRAESGDTDEIAALDADGNPTRSGIAKDDVITTGGGTIDADLEVTGELLAYVLHATTLVVDDTVEELVVNNLTISNTDPVDLTTEDGVLADSNGKYAHLSNISADDETFSNAVLAVGLNIDAETLQWLKDIGAIAGTTTGKVGIGTLLAALLAALMWLKRNKADKSELPYMTDLGDGRYEYTGAVVDAETRTYPGEVA